MLSFDFLYKGLGIVSLGVTTMDWKAEVEVEEVQQAILKVSDNIQLRISDKIDFKLFL